MNPPERGEYPFGLLERVGIELEYMIVDIETLDVRPLADLLLRDASGGEEWVSDVEPEDGGGIGWSNELVNHVIELKTIEPVADLAGVAGRFQRQVAAIEALLAGRGGRLLPTAMHPWMDPWTETRLWPHEHSPVYEKLDEIFSCRGHGWSNLQSAHLNLPFGDDAEFGRLHAAIRAVLPLLPALAASSPVRDGVPTGLADGRLAAYRDNCRRIPSITGRVIPEPVYDRASYEAEILARIGRDVAPFDAAGVLQPDWTNARGAIARFDRGSIEIRLLDVQECPAADLAIAELVCRTVGALLDERWTPLSELRALSTGELVDVLERTIARGEEAEVAPGALLRALGLTGARESAGEVWAAVRRELMPEPGEFTSALATIENSGTLATRITRRLATGAGLRDVYAELADCLSMGRPLS
ncbi:MAG: glutamate-cysteine ligase family protein [Gemmatimonadales bacterium]|jgi:gamma-glutamyl:cysteine ligase YbdK (ATP-grasp superfamily)